MKQNIERHIWFQIRYQTEDQIMDQTEDQIMDQIYDKVEDQFAKHIWIQIDQIKLEIRKEFNERKY